MDQQELLKRLTVAYLEELQEHVSRMNGALLTLEQGVSHEARLEHVNVLFRAAHTLKGSSRAVNLGVVEQVFHKVEDILVAIRDGSAELSPQLFTLLFRVVDALEQTGMQIRDEHDLSDSALAALLPQIEAFLQRIDRAAVPDASNDDSSSNSITQVAGEPAEPEKDRAKAVPPKDNQPLEDRATQARPVKAAAAPMPAPSSIRVAAQKLDDLLAKSGELLIARRRVEFRVGDVDALRQQVSQWKREWKGVEESLRQLQRHDDSPQLRLARRSLTTIEMTAQRLRDLEKELDRLASNMTLDGRLLGQVCETLEDEVHGIRMFPFHEVCSGLERAVRDVARATGKQVSLEVQGGDVEVDRSVLEGLKDPLLHLVRNAVDHGIEAPQVRVGAGKPAQATIQVTVQLKGAHVQVSVADDGKGFDLDRIRQQAKKRGMAVPDKQAELARMVFLPGFSTAKSVTDVSGRGVGLDVVQSRIESLHGEIDLTFSSGTGSCFTMLVPLTLTMIRTVMLLAGGTTYAIPTSSVQRIVRFRSSQLQGLGGRLAMKVGDKPIPVVPLDESLGVSNPSPSTSNDTLIAVVVGTGSKEIGFIVDDVLAEQEVVVQNLGCRIRRSRHVSGATLLPTGQLALVLNVANVIRSGLGVAPTSAAQPTRDDPQTTRRLLVVDDSVTTRTLIKTILETAGYDVTLAHDGQQAVEKLADSSFDLVVTDLDMPYMDGFDLTKAIRASAATAHLPVVLLTSRDSDEDKARGIQVGASSYVVKSGFDQSELLEAIGQLL